MNTTPFTRRQFLKSSAVTGAALAAPLILPSRLFGQAAPSKLITLGIVGTGNIADVHFNTLLGYPEQVRIRAVCDVDQDRRSRAATLVNAS